MKVRIKKLVLL
jgi:2'-5' RNA ligase